MLSLRIGGVLNFLCAVFHMMFWKLFDWSESLSCLSEDQNNIMQVLNIHLILAFCLFAYLSLRHSREMMSSGIGRLIMIFISIFYLIRIANEAIFWGFVAFESIVISLFCLLLSMVYFIAWRSSGAESD